jgi:hypothetical protein
MRVEAKTCWVFGAMMMMMKRRSCDHDERYAWNPANTTVNGDRLKVNYNERRTD